MWGKALCFVGGAALGYLAREQIAEAVDTVCEKVSDLMEDADNAVGTDAVSAENELPDGDNASGPIEATENAVTG
ncbi:hypothetical protein [Desulfovibrio intestinalis]|uniref:Uncharacterized protein n=1 Tax=Desulfovibrio intestinalis TaxID=58621 RepID=A0A7W8FF09_9BACT|nr:hypothetical protein [Desulfovibrio intestinalis]MBB5144334.1 hypothetical protein [Desulfovibrio intestinalis]